MESKETRVCLIIIEEEIGDWKPSQFLRHIHFLAGTSTLNYKIFYSAQTLELTFEPVKKVI